MGFCVIRLGKDSVNEIKLLDSGVDIQSTPTTFNFRCKQVERSIVENDYAFIYLGSDNSKGVSTSWKQGLRALGKIVKKTGGVAFSDECTLDIEVISNFPVSLDQYDFLEKSPDFYVSFSKYPVIGVKQSRNNAVQKVNEGEKEKTPALLTAIDKIYPDLKHDLSLGASDLLPYLNFNSEYSTSPKSKENTDSGENNVVGSNTIYYGAPGTGKSHSIDKKIGDDKCIKTVFHIETSNADFIGSIKPLTIRDDNDTTRVTYDFVPGPFIRAFINSINEKDRHHWLVIEEINRASAASVFGEVFQLLDRDSSGQSKYQIDFVDPTCKAYVEEKTLSSVEKLYLPSNLSLIASMNSSDQGVEPLDTAFKRRWKYNYVPLDFEVACAEANFNIVANDDELITVSWKNFAESINEILTEVGVPEDRHLGPFFISNSDLTDMNNIFTGKVFMYLWDDVLRHGLRSYVFDKSITTYGLLVKCWSMNKRVFSEDFLEKIMNVSQ